METEVPLVGLLAVPIVMALLQVLKPLLKDERLWPLVAIALGVAWNLAATWSASDTIDVQSGLVGVVMGLAASGLYSTSKTYIEGKPDVPSG